jgi:chromate reductase
VTTIQVGYFVGSLSSTSINRVLSRALIRVAPDDMEFTEIPIGDLPLYSPDFDADYPPEARALKASIAAVDALLFVTPEYNRSIPGALKNAIDWAIGSGELEGKVVAITAAVPGAERGRKGLQALRDTLGAVRATIVGGEPIVVGADLDRQVGELLEALAAAIRV